LLVVTRHPGGPPGRPKIHPALPLRAFLHHNQLLKIRFVGLKKFTIPISDFNLNLVELALSLRHQGSWRWKYGHLVVFIRHDSA
jgi:hypothetical protein